MNKQPVSIAQKIFFYAIIICAIFSTKNGFSIEASNLQLNGTCSGNADSVVDFFNVISEEKILGVPNFEGAIIGASTPTGYATVDLGDTLLAGENITMTWAAVSVGLEASVEVSTDNVSYTPVSGSPFNNTSNDVNAPDNQVITLPINTRYIKISNTSSGTIFIDGFTYTDAECLGGEPPTCSLSISNISVGNCIDHPYMDIATVDVSVQWTEPPTGEDIEVIIGDKTEIINVSGGLISPQTIQFILEADGSMGNIVTAQFETETTCSDTDSFNAPTACSTDQIHCDILYLCSFEKPSDGDAWDHGWLDYLDQINGTNTITPVLTKADASGLGLYDPNDDTQPVTVDFNDYELIIISATTETYIAADLIAAIKDGSAAILNSNYDISTELGMVTSEGYQFQDHAYTDNSTSTIIYNFDNPNSTFSPVVLKGDYLTNADAYLWTDAGEQASGIEGVLFAYDESDNLTGVVAGHGKRVFLGYHMNGVYANPDNGGAIPAPTSNWFNPVHHLTLEGKYYLDLALQLAADCVPCPPSKCGRVSVIRN